MGWIGKIVGGTIGLFLGGPLGAIAGAALGHGLDVVRDNYLGPAIEYTSPQHKAQFTFFVATFSMLAKLVKADGEVTNQEMQTIERFMNQELRLDPQSKQVAKQIFGTALHSDESFESLAMQFYQQFRDRPQLLELLLDILVRVAAADGHYSSREEDLIIEAVRIFGFTHQQYQIIKQRYVKKSDHAYAVLGCSQTDSNETIKKKYKELVFEYHPDTIASKGLPEEFTRYATEKFREIRSAYETIRDERGF
jgi:DnaJ like chaperone protein